MNSVKSMSSGKATGFVKRSVRVMVIEKLKD
jgi:hypothetical protein